MLSISSVLTGLSRISELDKDNVWEKIPLFSQEGAIDPGSEHSSDSGSDKTSDDDDSDFYEESIVEHLNCKQLSTRQRFRRRVLKFQFFWYELIPHEKSDKRQYSGRLYRDGHNRSLQLQSFMVSDLKSRARVRTDRLGDWSLAACG